MNDNRDVYPAATPRPQPTNNAQPRHGQLFSIARGRLMCDPFLPTPFFLLILFLYPTLVVLLTAGLYRRRITTTQRIALALSYAGILLIYGNSPEAHSSDITMGALLVLASAVEFALFMIGGGHLVPRFESRRFTAYSMSIACVATLIHFLALKSVAQLMVSPRPRGLAFALALIFTVAPAFLINAGIRRIGADHASI